MRRVTRCLRALALFALAFGAWAMADRAGLLPFTELEKFAFHSIARAAKEVGDLRRIGLEKRYNVTILTDLRSMDVDQLVHALSEDVPQLYVTLARVVTAVLMVSGWAAVRVFDALLGVCVQVVEAREVGGF